MTPALQKIVEGMAAELARQGREFDQYVVPGPRADRDVSLTGEFDLEKVARAGLKAAKDAGEVVLLAGAEVVPFDDRIDEDDRRAEVVSEALGAMIDAILEEKPQSTSDRDIAK